MSRLPSLPVISLAVAVAATGCEDKPKAKPAAVERVEHAADRVVDTIDKAGERAVDKVKGMVPDRVKSAARRVDQALDGLDTSELTAWLAKAKASIAAGGTAEEACSWVMRATDDRAGLAELRTLCDVEVPLGKATRAVVAAEKARAELPEAPSLTECSSDDWAAVQRTFAGSPTASDARWTALEARWAKACPGGR